VADFPWPKPISAGGPDNCFRDSCYAAAQDQCTIAIAGILDRRRRSATRGQASGQSPIRGLTPRILQMLTVLGGLAEFEGSLIKARCDTGIAASARPPRSSAESRSSPPIRARTRREGGEVQGAMRARVASIKRPYLDFELELQETRQASRACGRPSVRSVIAAHRERRKHIVAPHIDPSAIPRLTQTTHKLCDKLLL
jgi:hypothetical protein